MSELKCPFCQQELVEIQFGKQRYWSCINDKCNESVGFGGNLKLWQELIRTRKALDVAKEGLKEIQDKGEYVNPIDISTSCLDEITALEQKDK